MSHELSSIDIYRSKFALFFTFLLFKQLMTDKIQVNLVQCHHEPFDCANYLVYFHSNNTISVNQILKINNKNTFVDKRNYSKKNFKLTIAFE